MKNIPTIDDDNHKNIVEKIPTPRLMPTNGQDPINDVTWCYFLFYSDNSTAIDESVPSIQERENAWKDFFCNEIEEL